MTPIPLRGEVWLINLDPVRGHEQAGSRTCLVISDDLYNRGPSSKHIVLPITSKFKGISYHIEVTPPEGGLRTKSRVMCDDVIQNELYRYAARAYYNCHR
jgi:mRNA interferase MazF